MESLLLYNKWLILNYLILIPFSKFVHLIKYRKFIEKTLAIIQYKEDSSDFDEIHICCKTQHSELLSPIYITVA